MSDRKEQFKVVHLAFTTSGGAGKAMYWAHKALLDEGIDSSILVVKPAAHQPKVIQVHRPFWKVIQSAAGRFIPALRTPVQSFNHRTSEIRKELVAYSPPWSDFRPELHPLVRQADIVHLHWVAGLVNYPTFFKLVRAKMVWTFQDRHPMLGGFHYQLEADLYSDQLSGIEAGIKEVKQNAMNQREQITLVCPSRTMENLASKHPWFDRFKRARIQSGLDTSIYRFQPKKKQKKLRIGFIAEQLSNPWKGFPFILEYLSQQDNESDLEWVCAGHKSSEIPEAVEHVGFISSDQQMAAFYQSLDAFILPTLEDNFPNTVFEALCCGTPVLSFSVGGVLDMVEPAQNGWLSDQYDVKGIAELVDAFQKKQLEWSCEEISQMAHERYNLKRFAEEHIALYKSL